MKCKTGRAAAAQRATPRRPFFDQTRGKDTWYEFAQREHNLDVAKYCEDLWARFEPFCADPDHFLEEVIRDFEGRTWEMRVACAMLDAKHGLGRPAVDAPDVLATSPIRAWIEATAAQEGAGPDAAKRVYSLRQRTEGGEIGLYTISVDNIIKRITGALHTKTLAHANYVARGHVKPTEPFVVAVNAGMIPEAGDENDGIPLAVRAVYGYGDVTMIVPIDGGKPHVEWQSRPTITKKSGNPISTRVFVDGVVPHVSALLFSACATPNVPIQIASHLGEEWRDLVLIHNPTATNRLPRGWLRIGREYWVEGDRIRIKEWRAHTRVQRGWRWLRWRLGALRRSRRAV